MNKGFICKNCGSIVDKSYTKNSCLGNLTWIFFILISIGIGLIFYIIYKLNNRNQNCCPVCKAENTLVPLNTPVGQNLLKEFSDKYSTNLINNSNNDSDNLVKENAVSANYLNYCKSSDKSLKNGVIILITIFFFLCFGLVYCNKINKDVQNTETQKTEKHIIVQQNKKNNITNNSTINQNQTAHKKYSFYDTQYLLDYYGSDACVNSCISENLNSPNVKTLSQANERKNRIQRQCINKCENEKVKFLKESGLLRQKYTSKPIRKTATSLNICNPKISISDETCKPEKSCIQDNDIIFCKNGAMLSISDEYPIPKSQAELEQRCKDAEE